MNTCFISLYYHLCPIMYIWDTIYYPIYPSYKHHHNMFSHMFFSGFLGNFTRPLEKNNIFVLIFYQNYNVSKKHHVIPFIYPVYIENLAFLSSIQFWCKFHLEYIQNMEQSVLLNNRSSQIHHYFQILLEKSSYVLTNHSHSPLILRNEPNVHLKTCIV